ncbi:Sec-independent protein translocase TatB [Saccharopolyspora sp. NPDC050389]|uniref:Sec-independent protein translocase TatB n=1 Tax=Saccharopolyspora sp. NPDC050389 TaxID=3155516 RepID=UPI00340201B1
MSLEHLAVLLLAGLFILGPEKLPQAAAWWARTMRQVRGYAVDAKTQLRSEFGDDYRSIREPLEQLREPLRQLGDLRNLDPRRAVANYLLDDAGRNAVPAAISAPQQRIPRPGETPPFDVEAT